jgi:hypothetical protein
MSQIVDTSEPVAESLYCMIFKLRLVIIFLFKTWFGHTVRKDLVPSEHCFYWPGIISLLQTEKIFVICHFWCEDENCHL